MGVERRKRILAAATENFARAGYLGTSMADIARDVGLTGPGLMHYFPEHIAADLRRDRLFVRFEE